MIEAWLKCKAYMIFLFNNLYMNSICDILSSLCFIFSFEVCMEGTLANGC